MKLLYILLLTNTFRDEEVKGNRIFEHPEVEVPEECKEVYKTPFLLLEVQTDFSQLTVKNLKTAITCAVNFFNINLKRYQAGRIKPKNRNVYFCIIKTPWQSCSQKLTVMLSVFSSNELLEFSTEAYAMLSERLAMPNFDNSKQQDEKYQMSETEIKHRRELLMKYEDNIRKSRIQLFWGFDLASQLPLTKNRKMREAIFEALKHVGCTKMYNNSEIIEEFRKSFKDQAQRYGYLNYIEMKMQNSMAKNPPAIYELLGELLKKTKAKFNNIVKTVKSVGITNGIRDYRAWDRGFIKCNYMKETAPIDKYFPLNHVLDEIFKFIGKVFALHIEHIEDVNESLKLYDVYNDITKSMKYGSFYIDLFCRQSKNYQSIAYNFGPSLEAMEIKPIVLVSLIIPENSKTLSMSQIKTIFHEMGHCLEKIFNDDSKKVSDMDAIEFSSMFMEKLCTNEDVLLALSANVIKTKKLTLSNLKTYIREQKQTNLLYLYEKLYLAVIDLSLHLNTQDPWGEVVSSVRMKYGIDEDIIDKTCQQPLFFTNRYTGFMYSYIWCDLMALHAHNRLYRDSSQFKERALQLRELIFAKKGVANQAEAFSKFVGALIPNKKFFLKHYDL